MLRLLWNVWGMTINFCLLYTVVFLFCCFFCSVTEYIFSWLKRAQVFGFNNIFVIFITIRVYISCLAGVNGEGIGGVLFHAMLATRTS